MNIANLKEIGTRIQIMSAIDKATLFGGDLWQPLDENLTRHIYPIAQIRNEYINDRFVVKTPLASQINLSRPVYIKLNYRNLIFRLRPGEFEVHGDVVSCLYPIEARALEERKGGNRYLLPTNSQISLSLKRMERSIREMTYEMELKIIDVSEKGFAVEISPQNRDYLRKHDHFWLQSVDHKLLRVPVVGSVCYVAPKGRCPKYGGVRVGLSLSVPLQNEVFEQLKKKCLLVLSA